MNPIPPPLCPEIELALVAAALKYPSAVPAVIHLAEPSDFADPLLEFVWQQIRQRFDRGERTGMGDLAPAIESQPERQRLAQSVDLVIADQATMVDQVRVVSDFGQRRTLMALTEELHQYAATGTLEVCASDLVAQQIERLSGMNTPDKGVASFDDVARKVVSDVMTNEPIPRHSTGIGLLDRALGGGIYQGRFYGLGARMKHGKTAMLQSISYNLAMSDEPCPHLYVSLEGSAEELVQRYLSRHMARNSLDFLREHVRKDEDFRRDLQFAEQQLAGRGLRLVKRAGVTFPALRSLVTREVMSGEIKGVIVDYLQLVSGRERGDSEASHYDKVAQWLAEVSKRYGVWVIAAAQLNQEGNVRGSEGLLMACDLVMKQHKVVPSNELDPEMLWIEVVVSRYCRTSNVGSKDAPPLCIDIRQGPHIRTRDAYQRESAL